MDNRPTAIIVTFPVQFLIDLGNSVILYREGYSEKKVREVVKPGVLFGNKKAVILEGFKDCVRQIDFVNSDPEDYWLHTMGNLPVYTDNITHCYINILSKIRYKAKVICFERGKKGELITKKFGDGRKMSGKNWVLLHQFERLKPEIKMGGFQGFRYWKEDY